MTFLSRFMRYPIPPAHNSIPAIPTQDAVSTDAAARGVTEGSGLGGRQAEVPQVSATQSHDDFHSEVIELIYASSAVMEEQRMGEICLKCGLLNGPFNHGGSHASGCKVGRFYTICDKIAKAEYTPDRQIKEGQQIDWFDKETGALRTGTVVKVWPETQRLLAREFWGEYLDAGKWEEDWRFPTVYFSDLISVANAEVR